MFLANSEQIDPKSGARFAHSRLGNNEGSQVIGKKTADRPSVGSEESTPGSRSFAIAIGPALLDLVSALSLPPEILLRFTDRQRHELPGHQIAESALIRNGAVAQQLGQHAQSLIGQILVDEGFLPG